MMTRRFGIVNTIVTRGASKACMYHSPSRFPVSIIATPLELPLPNHEMRGYPALELREATYVLSTLATKAKAFSHLHQPRFEGALKCCLLLGTDGAH